MRITAKCSQDVVAKIRTLGVIDIAFVVENLEGDLGWFGGSI